MLQTFIKPHARARTHTNKCVTSEYAPWNALMSISWFCYCVVSVQDVQYWGRKIEGFVALPYIFICNFRWIYKNKKFTKVLLGLQRNTHTHTNKHIIGIRGCLTQKWIVSCVRTVSNWKVTQRTLFYFHALTRTIDRYSNRLFNI